MHRGGLLLVGCQRIQISDMEEKVMLFTPEEKREFRWDMNMVCKIMTKWAKKVDECTILGVPGQIEDENEHFELETGQVEYDAEQCARNK